MMKRNLPIRIKKEDVHRYLDENVFISTIEKIGEGGFLVQGELLENHILYGDQVSGFNAGTYFIEVARQGTLAMAHHFYDVPLDMGFIITGMSWDFAEKMPFFRSKESLCHCEITVDEIESKKEGLRKNLSSYALVYEGNTFLTGTASCITVPKKLIAKTVGSSSLQNSVLSHDEAVDVQDVQILDRKNILIARPQLLKNNTYQVDLIIDKDHKYFFEHPNNHVPGMMLLEAAKQFCIASLRKEVHFLKNMYGDFVGGAIEFTKFADLNSRINLLSEFETIACDSDYCLFDAKINFYQREANIGKTRCSVGFVSRWNDTLQAEVIK